MAWNIYDFFLSINDYIFYKNSFYRLGRRKLISRLFSSFLKKFLDIILYNTN